MQGALASGVLWQSCYEPSHPLDPARSPCCLQGATDIKVLVAELNGRWQMGGEPPKSKGWLGEVGCPVVETGGLTRTHLPCKLLTASLPQRVIPCTAVPSACAQKPSCHAPCCCAVSVNGVSMGMNDFITLPDGITVEVRNEMWLRVLQFGDAACTTYAPVCPAQFSAVQHCRACAAPYMLNVSTPTPPIACRPPPTSATPAGPRWRL